MPQGYRNSDGSKLGFQKGHKPMGACYLGHPVYGGFKKGDLVGKKNPNWKGGKTIDGDGYVLICSPSHPYRNGKGYVREHRLVVEKQIGRYLLPDETIHHLGEKQDNRPEKLMAFINDAVHQRFEKTSIVKPKEIIFDGRKLKGGDRDGKGTED
jgi:hypothetical protein